MRGQVPHPPAADPPPGEFLLCSCQAGAEAVVRAQVSAALPGTRPGAWRRGLVTFRLPAAARPGELLDSAAFARTAIHSLGQVTGPDVGTLAAAAAALAGGPRWDRVHCWSRQFAPGPPTASAPAVPRAAMLAACGLPADSDPEAAPGELVLDVVLDSPERWWVGWHRAADPATCWPGGIYPPAAAALPTGKVSRAWLKLDEAIAAFGIPFEPGQRAVELGAAPGGACQRLLEAGLHVVGVDPALVEPAVASLPRFTQWRMRAREVPLDRLAGVDWLVADMNIDPRSTLAAIGRLATARRTRLAGIVATLKIPDWSRAAELPAWLESFRRWGFAPRARQLSSGGREVCVVALPTRAPGAGQGRLPPAAAASAKGPRRLTGRRARRPRGA